MPGSSDPPAVDEDALCRDYEAGMGRVRLARKYGIGEHRVKTILQAHGVTMRPRAAKTAGIQTPRAEFEARIDVVVALIGRGLRDRRAVWKAVTDPQGMYRWPITVDTVDTYLRAARDILEAQYAENAATVRAEVDSQYAALFRAAWAAGDLKTAAGILADWNKFRGLYPAARVEHGSEGGGPLKIEWVVVDAEPQS